MTDKATFESINLFLLSYCHQQFSFHLFLTHPTPFYLDSVQHPCMGFEPAQPPSHLETVNEFTNQMHSALTEAKAALAKAQDDMTCHYNQH